MIRPRYSIRVSLLSGGSRISPRRGRQLPGGAPTYDFAKFSQKLHEIERIWTPRGGRASKMLLCRSALLLGSHVLHTLCIALDFFSRHLTLWILYPSHWRIQRGGGARDAIPLGSNFFHFHAVFGKKKLKNNSTFGIGAHPSGKSWIRHCCS